MIIKAIALDDEPPALQIISSFCQLTDTIELVKIFTRAEEATNYLTNFPVDLLFLDINMPSISGLDFKKHLQPNVMVIFTTAYSEFALKGFNLNAVDYLLKPFTPERFLQATTKATAFYKFLHQNEQAITGHINIRVDYTLIKVMLEDILLIEGLNDYLKIHLREQKPLVTRMTMKTIMDKLPPSRFIRIHRSYVVPLAKIEGVRNKSIYINGEALPIGSSYEKSFYEVFGKS